MINRIRDIRKQKGMTLADLAEAFDDIAEKKVCRVAAVADWTWDAYSRQHAAIWRALAAGESLPR